MSGNDLVQVDRHILDPASLQRHLGILFLVLTMNNLHSITQDPSNSIDPKPQHQVLKRDHRQQVSPLSSKVSPKQKRPCLTGYTAKTVTNSTAGTKGAHMSQPSQRYKSTPKVTSSVSTR